MDALTMLQIARPGQEWWSKGLFEWQADALHAQEERDRIAGEFRQHRQQMLALLTEVLPTLSGSASDPDTLAGKAAQAIERLRRDA